MVLMMVVVRSRVRGRDDGSNSVKKGEGTAVRESERRTYVMHVCTPRIGLREPLSTTATTISR